MVKVIHPARLTAGPLSSSVILTAGSNGVGVGVGAIDDAAEEATVTAVESAAVDISTVCLAEQ